MPTRHLRRELKRPLTDPEAAVEIGRTHPFSNANLDHLTMRDIAMVGSLEPEDIKIYTCQTPSHYIYSDVMHLLTVCVSRFSGIIQTL